MKTLNKILETLLDPDFDIDINISPINTVAPFGDRGSDWSIYIGAINDELELVQYSTEINSIIKMAQSLDEKLKTTNRMDSRLKKWIQASSVLKPIDIDKYINNENIKAARYLNDWIANANKFSELEKLASALGCQFHGWTGARPTSTGKIYGCLTWTLTSPNQMAQKKLADYAVKLNKIDPAVEVEFELDDNYNGVIRARLIKMPK